MNRNRFLIRLRSDIRKARKINEEDWRLVRPNPWKKAKRHV